jgi:hypothetical protein
VPTAILLLVVRHNIGTATHQKLLCGIGKNRYTVFSLAVFRHFKKDEQAGNA